MKRSESKMLCFEITNQSKKEDRMHATCMGRLKPETTSLTDDHPKYDVKSQSNHPPSATFQNELKSETVVPHGCESYNS